MIWFPCRNLLYRRISCPCTRVHRRNFCPTLLADRCLCGGRMLLSRRSRRSIPTISGSRGDSVGVCVREWRLQTNRVLVVRFNERNKCTVFLAIRELRDHALSYLECVMGGGTVLLWWWRMACVIMHDKLMQTMIDTLVKIPKFNHCLN